MKKNVRVIFGTQYCQADIEEMQGTLGVIDTDDLVFVQNLQFTRGGYYHCNGQHTIYYRTIRLKGINEPILIMSRNKEEITIENWEYEYES